MSVFVPFYDVPPDLVRGNWVYCTDGNRIAFGSIQGINLGGKAVVIGIQVAHDTEVESATHSAVPAMDGTLWWVPEWWLATTPDALIKYLNARPGSKLGIKSRAFIKKIEALDWVKSMRPPVKRSHKKKVPVAVLDFAKE